MPGLPLIPAGIRADHLYRRGAVHWQRKELFVQHGGYGAPEQRCYNYAGVHHTDQDRDRRQERIEDTFDPSHVLSNGKTVIQNTVASPIVDSTATYTQGGVDAGTTQYIDAFQRANFWGTVQTSSNYHLLLGTPCGILEAGDPLENNPNFGAYPYFVSSRSRARC